MQLKTLVCWVAGSAAAVLLGACATKLDVPVQPGNSGGVKMVEPAKTELPASYRFSPGDVLTVQAVGRPELTVTNLRVDAYGHITYPYLGQVDVRNLTAQEVADRLSRGLLEGDYYKRVALGVSYVESKDQYVYVLGEVKKPGPIPITGQISLLDAIGRAQGQTYDAEMSTVLWIRGSWSPPGVVRLDLTSLGGRENTGPGLPTLTMIPGDVIYVPDQAIVSVQRFFQRMYDIFRGVVTMETSVVLYDSVERVFSGRYPPPNSGGQTIIVLPGK